MNLDKASAASTDAPLAPPDWTMKMVSEGHHFTADISRAGNVMCRLSVVRSDDDAEAARAQLADKARFWIHEYLARSRAP